jgi:membrane-associated phospholipid phosphatase
MGVHYPSDVFVGMIVGLFWGFLIFQLQKIFFIKTYNESISI